MKRVKAVGVRCWGIVGKGGVPLPFACAELQSAQLRCDSTMEPALVLVTLVKPLPRRGGKRGGK